MDILFNMRAFVSVAETGSFTAAAQRLDLTTAYVSRAVAKLEAHLQTRLLHRTTRRIALTEAGQRYLMRAQQILAYIEEAEAEAGDAHARPSGTLKVHAMTGIGQHYLIKAISQYCETYPEVGFDLTLANRITDILDEGYDISVVIAPELPDSGFVSKCIGQTYSILCASPGYIAAHGFPKLPAELSAHRCLRLVNSVMSLDRWLFDGPDGQELACINQTHFQVNTADAMTEAVVSGMGIGALPVYAAVNGLKDGSLVRVLPRYSLFHLNVYALYPRGSTWMRRSAPGSSSSASTCRRCSPRTSAAWRRAVGWRTEREWWAAPFATIAPRLVGSRRADNRLAVVRRFSGAPRITPGALSALQAVSHPLQLLDQRPQATRQCFQVAYQQAALADRPGLVEFDGRQLHRPAVAARGGLRDHADADAALDHPADRLEAGDLDAQR